MIRLDRISQNPAVMGGNPCIRGLRIRAGMIVGGSTPIELLGKCSLTIRPYDREDILQALRYASELAKR